MFPLSHSINKLEVYAKISYLKYIHPRKGSYDFTILSSVARNSLILVTMFQDLSLNVFWSSHIAAHNSWHLGTKNTPVSTTYKCDSNMLSWFSSNWSLCGIYKFNLIMKMYFNKFFLSWKNIAIETRPANSGLRWSIWSENLGGGKE